MAIENPEVYPVLPAGSGHLPQQSVALIDQIRSLDVSRVAGYLGSLDPAEYEPVRRGLMRLLA